jgi:hypothetical protein
MARRSALTTVLAALAALAFGGPAAAKELTRVTICGRADACATITGKDLGRLPLRADATAAAPALGPFYWVTLRVEDRGVTENLGVLYVADADVLAANGWLPGELLWLRIGDPGSARLLREAVRDIEPYPAPNAWHPGLKSTYRVNLEVPATLPSFSPRREARGTSASGAGLPVAIGLGLLAALLGAGSLRGRYSSVG